jgi:(p)ppGpp synthase/HD superfamily hydrolase
MLTIAQTIDYVYHKFDGKFRKGTVGGEQIPAALHSLGVFYAAYRYGVHDLSALRGYAAHDVLEDTDTTVDELIEKLGHEATNIVEEMNFDPKTGSKALYMASFQNKSIKAVVGKAIDRIENVNDFKVSDPEYAKIYIKKANELFKTFNSRSTEIVNTFGADVYVRIREAQLRMADGL